MSSVLMYLFSWIITRCFASGQLLEDQYNTDVECYLSPSPLNTTCPTSHFIALQHIIAGAKLRSTNCSTEVSTSCCSSSPDSCEFYFPVDDLNYYNVCNGRLSCRPRVQSELSTDGNCSHAIYLEFTNYMFFEYYCIPESRIDMVQDGVTLSVVNSTLYLVNQGYPEFNISSSIVEQTCSVETDDCNSQIHVYTIERILASELNGSCTTNQFLSISTDDGTVLVNWTCADNTYTLSDYLTPQTYMIVTLSNTLMTDLGRFWIGFSATGNLTISCPTVERQHYCIPETTTSLSTTTATTTTTLTTSTTSTATTTTTPITTTTTTLSTTSDTSTTTSSTTMPTTTSTTDTPTTTASTTSTTMPTTTSTTDTPTTTASTTPSTTSTTTPSTTTTTTATTTTDTTPTTTKTTPPSMTPFTTTATSSISGTSTQTDESSFDATITVILLIVVIGLLVIVLCFIVAVCILLRSKNDKQAKQADIEKTNVTATTDNHLSGLNETVSVTEPDIVPASESETVNVDKPESIKEAEPFSDVSSVHSHVTMPLGIQLSEDQHQTSSVIQPTLYSSSKRQESHKTPEFNEESSVDVLNEQELETKLDHQLVLQVPGNKTHQSNENQIDNSKDTGSMLNDNDEVITTRKKHVRKKSKKKHRTREQRSNLIPTNYTDKTVEPSLVPVPIAETSIYEQNSIENKFDIQTAENDCKNSLENVAHDLQNQEVRPQYQYPTRNVTRNVRNYLEKSNGHLGTADQLKHDSNAAIKDLHLDEYSTHSGTTTVSTNSENPNRQQLQTTCPQYSDTNRHTMTKVTHHQSQRRTSVGKHSYMDYRPRVEKKRKSEDISKYEKLYRIVQCSSMDRRADLDDKLHKLNLLDRPSRRVKRSNSKVYPDIDYSQQRLQLVDLEINENAV